MHAIIPPVKGNFKGNSEQILLKKIHLFIHGREERKKHRPESRGGVKNKINDIRDFCMDDGKARMQPVRAGSEGACSVSKIP